jgi:hypothetical protein
MKNFLLAMEEVRSNSTPYVVISCPIPFDSKMFKGIADSMGIEAFIENEKSGRIEIRFSKNRQMKMDEDQFPPCAV